MILPVTRASAFFVQLKMNAFMPWYSSTCLSACSTEDHKVRANNTKTTFNIIIFKRIIWNKSFGWHTELTAPPPHTPSSVCWLYPGPAARCGAAPLSVWLQHHPAAYTGEGSAPQTPAQPLPTLPESNRRIHTPQKEPGEGRRGGGEKKTEEKGGVRRAEIKEREF